MQHYYLHQQDSKLRVIVAEEKVPDIKLFGTTYQHGKAMDYWLERVKFHNVYPGDEEKFLKYILTEYMLPDWEGYLQEAYILLPNKVVGFLWASPDGLRYTYKKQDGYTQYAFFNQPKEKKTELVELTDNYIRAVSNYVPEWASKLEELRKEIIAKLDSSVLPEEKDLWPSDEDVLNMIPFSGLESDTWRTCCMREGAKEFRDQLKPKYNLVKKPPDATKDSKTPV